MNRYLFSKTVGQLWCYANLIMQIDQYCIFFPPHPSLPHVAHNVHINKEWSWERG